jgi:hypothetical protein
VTVHTDCPAAAGLLRAASAALGQDRAAQIRDALAERGAVTLAARGLAFDAAFWWAIGLTALALVPALLLPASRSRPADEPVGGRIRNAVEEPAEDAAEHRLLWGRTKKQRG